MSNALRLMQDAAFKSAMVDTEERLLREITNSEQHQSAQREEAYRRLRVLRSLAASIARQYEDQMLEAERARREQDGEDEPPLGV